ncbi:MAG: hypothetical protein LC640_12825, partial [Frankia sp.]|nr:hypothetical protein [Frankia sp.]
MQNIRLTRSVVAPVLAATAVLVGIAGPSFGAAPARHTVSFTSPFVDEGSRPSEPGACGPARPGV